MSYIRRNFSRYGFSNLSELQVEVLAYFAAALCVCSIGFFSIPIEQVLREEIRSKRQLLLIATLFFCMKRELLEQSASFIFVLQQLQAEVTGELKLAREDFVNFTFELLQALQVFLTVCTTLQCVSIRLILGDLSPASFEGVEVQDEDLMLFICPEVRRLLCIFCY